ncbi:MULTISPECIES: hypothetical protein [Burkholderia cepacia complex]|uniref:hypothetical protein n=1 Tax=Burkholderia cepacia complex TaxID=87882 RepID=UPI00157A277A|nr:MULTISPECIES: hypothetical protein [Burkholderia cepacia complex]NTY41487.1 hypothetical protein [Burkholderia diffusa]
MRKLPSTTDPAADADVYHVPRPLVVFVMFIDWIAERFAQDWTGVVVAGAMRSCSRPGIASRVPG